MEAIVKAVMSAYAVITAENASGIVRAVKTLLDKPYATHGKGDDWETVFGKVLPLLGMVPTVDLVADCCGLLRTEYRNGPGWNKAVVNHSEVCLFVVETAFMRNRLANFAAQSALASIIDNADDAKIAELDAAIAKAKAARKAKAGK